MVDSPLIRPYLLGGGSFGGAPLDSHDKIIGKSWWENPWDGGPLIINPIITIVSIYWVRIVSPRVCFWGCFDGTGCLGSRVTNLSSVENPDWVFLHRDFDYPLIWHSNMA